MSFGNRDKGGSKEHGKKSFQGSKNQKKEDGRRRGVQVNRYPGGIDQHAESAQLERNLTEFGKRGNQSLKKR